MLETKPIGILSLNLKKRTNSKKELVKNKLRVWVAIVSDCVTAVTIVRYDAFFACTLGAID